MNDHEEGVLHWRLSPNVLKKSKPFIGLDTNMVKRPMRFAYTAFDSPELVTCQVLSNVLTIRTTHGDRQQIKALYFDDDKSIQRLVFQRFTSKTEAPYAKQSFSFTGDEIEIVLKLFAYVKGYELEELEELVTYSRNKNDQNSVDDKLLQFVHKYQDEIYRLDENGSFGKYLEFCRRKEQVEEFERLLLEKEYFNQQLTMSGQDKPEFIWQKFFEANPWIFGLNLSLIFMSNLSGRKLEQFVKGSSIAGRGKRVDGLMRTNGILRSLCFVEVKQHTANLLGNQFRPDCWPVSQEITQAIAQCQGTIQSALDTIGNRLRPTDKDGYPTGEDYFLYQPRSFLVVGRLSEFVRENGANESQFRSFELFRKNIHAPEIVTYDELLERVKASLSLSNESISSY